jgi:2-polyprenyl-3-methyl-5-hydroxy-6-metoxy-1,4-benzoquinol methylase
VSQVAVDKSNHRVSAELSTDQGESGAREAAACILCGGALKKGLGGLFDTRFGLDGSYEVRLCRSCGLEQTSPIPTLPALKALYESHYNFGGEKDTLYTNLRARFYSSFLYRFWIRLDGDVSFHGSKGTGHLLDIGCNEGRGLNIYARNGFEVEGLELNAAAAAKARETGFKVHMCELADLSADSVYDVAVLSNVLEHSLDPRSMLVNVNKILKPGGKVWISCPNSRSFFRKLFGVHWINWHVPFHIAHFDAESLANLLRETGFSTILIRPISPAIWVTHSIIAKVFARKARPTREIRNPVFVAALLLFVRLALFPALWLTNQCGRGDCLLVAATKM